MDRLEGKTAFVTGGASGIGLALCSAFGQRGMNVAMGYRRQRAVPELGQDPHA
jgi:NAD(P)-dependent dehydrogenase (short-subunit alcohol dehydrogenase family)